MLSLWNEEPVNNNKHYGDAIMDAIASQITSLTIVYSTVYSDADEMASNTENFSFDDVIMNGRILRLELTWWWLMTSAIVWPLFHFKDHLSRYGIPTIKIRRLWDRLIFIMRIPIPAREHVLIEPDPWLPRAARCISGILQMMLT